MYTSIEDYQAILNILKDDPDKINEYYQILYDIYAKIYFDYGVYYI